MISLYSVMQCQQWEKQRLSATSSAEMSETADVLEKFLRLRSTDALIHTLDCQLWECSSTLAWHKALAPTSLDAHVPLTSHLQGARTRTPCFPHPVSPHPWPYSTSRMWPTQSPSNSPTTLPSYPPQLNVITRIFFSFHFDVQIFIQGKGSPLARC